MDQNFERELPEGYTEALTVDAADKKLLIIFNLGDLVLTGLIIWLAVLWIRPTDFHENFTIARNVVFIAALLLYIVLHELTHGLAYYLSTGEKLKFGMTLTYAYCGVPDIYVYRKTALLSLLAPFTVFSVVFLAAIIAFADPWDKFYAAICFAVHFGGCIGDLYDTVLYQTRFRDSSVLMRDFGVKQVFYTKNESC